MSEVTLDATEAPVANENESKSTAGRGRPRPDATIERDNRVLEHIKTNGSKTKKQLAEELEMQPNEVYLSLYRLSRDDMIVRAGTAWAYPQETAE